MAARSHTCKCYSKQNILELTSGEIDREREREKSRGFSRDLF